MTTRHANLIDDIISDHREVEQIFGEIENTTNPATRRELVDHVITELVRHSVAEEWYLYPTARRVLHDGDKIADHEIEEHAEAEKIMKQIEKTEAEDAEFNQLVGKLMKKIRHHVEDEEKDLLPKLRDACDDTELGKLGEQFEEAKNIAPTRPHPSAPDTPPANKILDTGVGLVDRVRDALSRRH